ncbi:MAG: PEGA domain-containing protein [Acidobacteriota bacterium]
MSYDRDSNIEEHFQQKARIVFCRNLLHFLALIVSVISPVVYAQFLPPSLGEVDVKERTAAPITRTPKGSSSTPRFTNGVLFVLTEPRDAEIAINGKSAGRARDGEFRKELRAGSTYRITVSAGSDYEPFKETVVLESRRDKVLRASLVSKYGLVRIGPALEGAQVFIDDKPVPADRAPLDKDSNTIKIDNLTPGEHKISYRHPDYVPLERRFQISPSSEYIWTFNPEPATVELTVRTDPETFVYIDGEPKGKTTADGVLKRSDVRLGTHNIKLVKEDFEEYKQTIDFKYREPVTVDKRLVPLPTSAGFDDNFDVPKPKLWTMPAEGLTFKDKRLYVENAKALGTPADIRYRGFEMSFHLKLANAGGAAWAVRVKDSNNYYLFYLAGPSGLFPNTFNTYIVRNNEFDPRNPVKSHDVTVPLVANGQYQIHIKGTGNIIEHEIKPAASGDTVTLGFFEDKDSTFLLGGIGFRTVALEKFSIDDLFVRPR